MDINTYRKITIVFKTENNLNNFSKRLFSSPEQKLLPNMKEVYFDDGVEFVFKRNVRLKPREMKEWEYHWNDLTPFENNELDFFAKIDFFFSNEYTSEKLSNLLEQSITDKTKSTHYPKKEIESCTRSRIIGDRGNPQYPIYIISKGRSENCITADHLIKMGVPFNIVVEKQEIELYTKYYPREILIELDMSFRDEYDTYIDGFDETKSKGSGPARNFVWWHSKNVKGSKWHWLMDDNIYGFHYYNDNERIKAVDGTIFAAAEDFVNRYDNISISGLNYYMFAVPGTKDKPYVANTKIYSCLLINNESNVRWAGRYNEDVDICIRALKEGYATIQFDAFLAKKGPTQALGGGNTDAFYAEEGTLPKSNMLMHNHPDITNVMWRFQRWHHITNYDIFDYYKDRTIGQTIEDMMKPPILSKTDDKEIIEKISQIDFSKIKSWNILEDVEPKKREEILKALKFYRYKKNTEEIISHLTRSKLLNCDYYDFIWDKEIPKTVDNQIMRDLLNLVTVDDKIFYSVDWDSYLPYISKERRKEIVRELTRNKYLQKSHEKFSYNLQKYIVTEDEHLSHDDSKAKITNILYGSNLEVPVTHFDKKIRNEVEKTRQKKFQKNLTNRGTKITREDSDYTVLIHGSEDFTDEKFFLEKINSLNADTKAIINSVFYPVDLMAANYALDKKMKNKEFVPDKILFTNTAYKVAYSEMAEYADEAILFISTLNDDLEFLIKSFEQLGKQITVYYDKISVLEDW